ncbi:phosphotransferase [Streptomyces goshikiensis]|uniref:phosphotransferase enzyme family protein n=1 Tax=Streptomyces goshikiensis TaxID=1942 RepID=UPI0033C8DB08
MPLFEDLPRDIQLAAMENAARTTLANRYGITPGAFTLQQYEDNCVYRIETDTGPHTVRMSVRDGRPPHHQASELAWLDSLARAHTVTAPRPLTTTDGTFITETIVEGLGPSTVAIFEWVPGHAEPPFREPGIAEGMGAVTAQLHHHAQTTALPDNFARPTWDAADILDRGYALTHPDHPLLGANGAAVLRAVAERIHAHGPLPERDRGLIHGDLHRENMLLTPNGSIAVIDFDDCGLGAYTLDIATVLSSIHRLCRNDSEAYADFAHRFLTAYEKIRPLPESMDRFEDFLLLRDAFIVNFVTSSTNTEVATWGPRRVAGLIAQMQAHLAGDTYPGTLTS